jgi:hypothetical protein
MRILLEKIITSNEGGILVQPSVLLSQQQVEAFVRHNFTPQMQADRTRILGGAVTAEELSVIVSRYDHAPGKWKEYLTLYDFNGQEIREDIPKPLAHILALPHGASDCLIVDPVNNLVLVNYRTNNGAQEGIGGHKQSGLTFTENMTKELLEEVFGMPENSETQEEMEKALQIETEYLPLITDSLYYTNNRTVNSNYDPKNNWINIHVSDLHILRVIGTQIPTRLAPEASAGFKWVDFKEANRIANSEGFFFGILWNNLVETAGGLANLREYVASLQHD